MPGSWRTLRRIEPVQLRHLLAESPPTSKAAEHALGATVQPFFLPDLKDRIRGHEEIARKELGLFLVTVPGASCSGLFSKYVLMQDQMPKLMGCARDGALNTLGVP